jgi:hypothetical protein
VLLTLPSLCGASTQLCLDVGQVGRAWETYMMFNRFKSGTLPSLAQLKDIANE